MHSFFDFIHFRELGQKYKNIFVRFLVQMKTSKFAFEIIWPLPEVSWFLPEVMMQGLFHWVNDYLPCNGEVDNSAGPATTAQRYVWISSLSIFWEGHINLKKKSHFVLKYVVRIFFQNLWHSHNIWTLLSSYLHGKLLELISKLKHLHIFLTLMHYQNQNHITFSHT